MTTTNFADDPHLEWPTARESRSAQALVFAPLAWLKLQYLTHAGTTEVGGFGLSHPDNPLYLEDVLLVRQRCSWATVHFDDQAIADLFDAMADQGLAPERFARVWLHTHPGLSAVPSSVDEATFARAFGSCDWAVMAILSRGGRFSARLQLRAGPGAEVDLTASVDWAHWPSAVADTAALAIQMDQWRQEYAALVEFEDPRHAAVALPEAITDNGFFDPRSFFPAEVTR